MSVCGGLGRMEGGDDSNFAQVTFSEKEFEVLALRSDAGLNERMSIDVAQYELAGVNMYW